jgi:hypothetical protein
LDCGCTAIYGQQVSDSRGQSVGGGYGLSAATTAQNCYGTSSSGTGLYPEGTAIACYGDTTTGPRGLYARNAAFCVGSRPSGTAIEATIANGCWAEFGTLLITFKYNMPLAKNLQPETFNPNRPMKTQFNLAALAPARSADFQSQTSSLP